MKECPTNSEYLEMLESKKNISPPKSSTSCINASALLVKVVEF